VIVLADGPDSTRRQLVVLGAAREQEAAKREDQEFVADHACAQRMSIVTFAA
jgi:hypothetical protein